VVPLVPVELELELVLEVEEEVDVAVEVEPVVFGWPVVELVVLVVVLLVLELVVTAGHTQLPLFESHVKPALGHTLVSTVQRVAVLQLCVCPSQ
jgi:hypothetical protein